MTIIRIATESKEIARRLDRELRGRGFQSAPSGIYVSTDAPQSIIDRALGYFEKADTIIDHIKERHNG